MLIFPPLVRRLILGSFSNTWTLSLTSNDSGQENYSYRNVIPAADISTSGDVIRVTFESSTAGSFNVDNASIMQHSGGGVGTGDIGILTFSGGSSGFSISSSSTIVSDNLVFPLNEAAEYLVVIDISSTNGNPRRLDGSGACYLKSGDTYNSLNPGGLTGPISRVYATNKIEVASYS
jgi:hypothetical protein